MDGSWCFRSLRTLFMCTAWLRTTRNGRKSTSSVRCPGSPSALMTSPCSLECATVSMPACCSTG
uniref:Uncharacterized protein n=1 Tax=Zea mays TaxID=4577 RepID=B4FXH3_MAIZE|nr:unknown [Zea mays]